MSFGETVRVTPGRVRTADGGSTMRLVAPYDLTGCVIGPAATGEIMSTDRDGVFDVVTIHVTGPTLTPPSRFDRLTIRGEEYEVVGRRQTWVDPEGDPDLGGLVIDAERVEG